MSSRFHSDRPLVFIAGALRSGSTLLTLMLARHSMIDCPGEFDYLFDAFPPDCSRDEVNAVSASHLDERLSEHQGFLMRDAGAMEAAPTTTDRLRQHVASLQASDRTLALCLHRDFVTAREVFPDARFVHLVRDPRDCARSAMGMGWAGNVYYGLEPWLRAEESWELLKPRLRPDQCFEVRYEELVTEPQRVLGEVCAFLGHQYDPQMLDLSSTTYETPSARYANQWRGHMSSEDEKLVVARAGDLMARRGYEPSAGLGGGIGCLKRVRLHVQNRIWRHRFRFRRYGLQLYLRELLTRKLGQKRAHRQAVIDILAVDKRFMK